MKHLLSIADLGADGINEVLDLTDSFVEVSERRIPKVPTLRGRTVVSLFYEESTRTRLSFESAAKRLSADTMNFNVATSSVKKGESLRDTVLTIEAMGVDAIVVRHASAGVPWQLAGWVDAAVVNAGDGWHEHPTQALLDCYTIRERLGGLADRHIAIVGDVKHSRVARSDVLAFTALGAEVTLVAPPTLLPPSLAGWPVTVSHDLDDVLPKVDVVYLLRMQRERQTEALVPSLREYTATYGLTRDRARLLGADALVMHPGPMNRGVEIAAEVADLPRSVVTRQVANGVAVRMAVLFLLLAADGRPDPAPGGRRCLSSCCAAARWSTPPGGAGPTSPWTPRGGSRRWRPTWTPTGRSCSTPRAASSPRAWSTSTPTCASPARRRRRRWRPVRAPPPSAATPPWWPCPTPSRPSTPPRPYGRSSSSAGRRSARSARRAPSPRVGRASSWRPWPRWRRSGCGSSPTTGRACRTAG